MAGILAASPALFRWFAALAAAATALACWSALRRFRGTTFAAPVVWGAVGAGTVAAVETLLAAGALADRSLAASVARYVAAAGTFCGPMAVLGAKRPQDRGWQWIVAALWLVLALPALQGIVTRAGERVELGGLWAAFLLVLAVYSTALNYGPTRFAFPATLLLAAQGALLAPATRRGQAVLWSDDQWTALGAGLLFAAIVAAFRRGRAVGPGFAASDGNHADPALRWLAFRDAFGLSWGLRIQHRVNETARLARWPVRLSWRGFVAADPDSPSAVSPDAPAVAPPPDANETLDTLLRRFERSRPPEQKRPTVSGLA